MKTKITKVSVDWKEIKNQCRHTDNKDDTENEATEKFIKQILISEHSPIQLARIKWSWDKWVSTQRTDRTGVNRDKSPQDTPVNMDIEANAQALINVSRYRLCYQSAKETREYMEDLKAAIKECGQENISNVMVPNCIYRMGCPEFKSCGHIDKFIKWCFRNNKKINELDIQVRYDLYNEYFYSEVYKK